MNKRMTESQIVSILKETDAGVPVIGVSTEFGENSTLRNLVEYL